MNRVHSKNIKFDIRNLCFNLLLILSISSTAVFAESDKGQLDAAFKDMMSDLSNPEKSYRYAQIAIEQQEVKGAISALERLLLTNPNLDNIRLELGTLYHRVGSYGMATHFLNEAIASDDIPENVKERARGYLKDAEKKSSPHQLGGYVNVGFRYDDNVNFGPSSANVFAPTGPGNSLNPAVLSEGATEDSDTSTYANAKLGYSYILPSQAAHTLYADLNLSGSFHNDRNDYDHGFAGITTGAWFNMDSTGTNPWSIGPFITTGYLGLDYEKYLTYYGGGVSVRFNPANRWAAQLTGQVKDQDYSNTAIRITAEEQSGTETELSLYARYLINSLQNIYFSTAITNDNADVVTQANDEWRFLAGYQIGFQGPFGSQIRPWFVNFNASYRNQEFDAADARIDPNTVREDDRYGAAIITTVPVGQSSDVNLTLEYTKNKSNILNFEYDNFAIALGFVFNF